MNGTLIACQVETIQTRRDGSIKLVFGTQEMAPSKGAELLGLMNKLVAVYISQKETISAQEMKQVDAVESEFEGKSQSQRIRNVLYILFTQDSEGMADFEVYYRSKTNKIIDHLKNKIQQ